MAKYSYEFKRKIVLEYLQGSLGYESLAKKYHIPSSADIKKWVAIYHVKGEDGLRRSRQQAKYSFKFKLHAVELYLSTETSYKDLAFALGMKEPSVLVNWVSRYRAVGIEGLKPQRKGRHPKMVRPSIPKKPQDEQQAYLQQLEAENYRLRLENACLKGLRRLRLEEEAAQKKKQDSHTASEDPID